MIVIEYCESGVPISDFEVKAWARELVIDYLTVIKGSGRIFHVSVSTSAPIHAVRLAIASGDVDHEDVTFVHGDLRFKANEYGAIVDWPKGFADVGTEQAENILRIALGRRKEERTSMEVVEIQCQSCGDYINVLASRDGLEKWRGGGLIQDCLPGLSLSDRELLVSETCGKCFDEMFAEEHHDDQNYGDYPEPGHDGEDDDFRLAPGPREG